MHCLNNFRVRILIVIIVCIILWQIFRNLPTENDFAVSVTVYTFDFGIELNEIINIFIFFEIIIGEFNTPSGLTSFSNGFL